MIILKFFILFLLFALISSQDYISIVPVISSSSGECGSSFDLVIGEEGSFISYSSSTFTFGSFIANHNQAVVFRRIDSGSLTWCRNIIGSNYQISGALYDISEDSLHVFVSQSDYNYSTTNLYFYPSELAIYYHQTGFPLIYSMDQTPGPLLNSISLTIDTSQQHFVRSSFIAEENLFNIKGDIYRCPNPYIAPPFNLIINLKSSMVESIELVECASPLVEISTTYIPSPSLSPTPSPSIPREYFISLVPITPNLSSICASWGDLLIGDEDSYLIFGDSIYTFGYYRNPKINNNFSPILRRLQRGAIRWCQQFPFLSGNFVGAMWDKNFNTLYVSINVIDLQLNETIGIRIMQIDVNYGNQINQIIEIGSSDNRTPPPQLLDIVKESPNYITALFERSTFISVNNQMYYCSGQESDWNVTFTLDLSIIQVDSVCTGGGVVQYSRSNTRSQSLTPTIILNTYNRSPSPSPSPSRQARPSYRFHSITLVPAFPSKDHSACSIPDEFIGGSYFEIGSSFYAFQYYSYSSTITRYHIRRIDSGKFVWCVELFIFNGGEIIGAMWDSDFNSLYVAVHYYNYADQFQLISVDITFVKIDINNGDILEEVSILAPTLWDLFKENQNEITAIFCYNSNFLFVGNVIYYCSTPRGDLWTMILDIDLNVLDVRNDGCPTGVIIINSSISPSHSLSPSPSPSRSISPSPSTSSTSYGSISMFIKNEMTFGCGYDDIQLGGEGTYFNVSDGTTFTFGIIIPGENPQPVLRRIEWKEVVVHVINDVVRWCRILIDQDSINTGKGALYRAAMWDYVTNSLYLILQYYYHIYPDFVSMMEVKIMKIDINTGYAQYQTSLYPIAPESLGVEIPQLVEIYKENLNVITTLFDTKEISGMINVNGITYDCSSHEGPFASSLWTIKYSLELEMIEISLDGCNTLIIRSGTTSLTPTNSFSPSASPSIYNYPSFSYSDDSSNGDDEDESCVEDHSSSSTSEDHHHNYSSFNSSSDNYHH